MKIHSRFLLMILFSMSILSGCNGDSAPTNSTEAATFDSATFDNATWD